MAALLGDVNRITEFVVVLVLRKTPEICFCVLGSSGLTAAPRPDHYQNEPMTELFFFFIQAENGHNDFLYVTVTGFILAS